MNNDDEDKAWSSQREMEQLKGLMATTKYSDLVRVLEDNSAEEVGDDYPGDADSVEKHRSIIVAEKQIAAVHDSLFDGDEYVEGGYELFLCLLNAHPTLWVIIVFIRVSPYERIVFIQQVYHSQWIRLYSGSYHACEKIRFT